MEKKPGEDKKEDRKIRLETREERNNVFEAGKTPYLCQKCSTIWMLYPEQTKKCACGSTDLKPLNAQGLRAHILTKEISRILENSEDIAQRLIKDIQAQIKNNLHVIIGLCGGVLQDAEVFIEDDKATEYEKELCEEYDVPFDKEERQNYYDSDGEHAVHHLITKLQ